MYSLIGKTCRSSLTRLSVRVRLHPNTNNLIGELTMSFIVDKKHKEEKIAKKDIIVYKIVNVVSGNIFSYFQNYAYRLKEKNKKVNLQKKQVAKIHELINEGYHSTKEAKMAKSLHIDTARIAKCIIPAGARYYYNSLFKSYVSDEIIIDQIL